MSAFIEFCLLRRYFRNLDGMFFHYYSKCRSIKKFSDYLYRAGNSLRRNELCLRLRRDGSLSKAQKNAAWNQAT